MFPSVLGSKSSPMGYQCRCVVLFSEIRTGKCIRMAVPCLDNLSVHYWNKLLREQQDHQACFPRDFCLKTDLWEVLHSHCSISAAILTRPLSHRQLLIFTKPVKTQYLWHLYLSARFDRIWPAGSQLLGEDGINTACFHRSNFCEEASPHARILQALPTKQMLCNLVPNFTRGRCRHTYCGVAHAFEVQVYQIWNVSNNKQHILLLFAERVPCEIQRAQLLKPPEINHLCRRERDAVLPSAMETHGSEIHCSYHSSVAVRIPLSCQTQARLNYTFLMLWGKEKL